DPNQDVYVCPENKLLIYSTTDRNGYRHYRSEPSVCQRCERRSSCTQNRKAQKTITRHVWEESKETANELRLTKWGKKIYERRKETVERSFADAKQHHGHRYARFRGLMKVQMQCLLAATAQNMKKIALMVALFWFYKQYWMRLQLIMKLSRALNRQNECRQKNIAIATFGR
ncbi:transposase, partial [Budvicia aquatica]|uniref:transposase n=1 Tax=Budvicia aquatica TaxID=82979 RepID=UPI0021C2E689